MGNHKRVVKKWGWNGDICAVWGDAIILGERHEKESKAVLFASASNLLDVLKWAKNYVPSSSICYNIIEEVIEQAENTKNDKSC